MAGTRIKHNKTERRLLAARRPARVSASILIRDLDCRPLFVLDFYGIGRRELCTVPGGGNLVAAALRRRGIDPHSVMFTLWDVS